MPKPHIQHAHLRTWLALSYVFFISYASLSPFTGWAEQGLNFCAVLQQPFLQTYTRFDAFLNWFAYVPLGVLLSLIARNYLPAIVSLLAATVLGAGLSATMEFLQMYLPTRTSSNLDLLTNASGAMCGAIFALSITRWTDLYATCTRLRLEFFRDGKQIDFGLALLALWMFVQINPSLPMLGNVFISATAHQPFVRAVGSPFDAWESVAVGLNLLMLSGLLLTVLRQKMHALSLTLLVLIGVASLKFLTALALLKSSALLLWINPEAMLGLFCGILILVAIQNLSRLNLRRIIALVIVAYLLVAHLILTSSPAAAMSIYVWRYGHLLNYNDLCQTITTLFPVLLILHIWRVRKIEKIHY
jgi:VanZ family protein